MSKFKVGDRVRCVWELPGGNKHIVGKFGTIINVNYINNCAMVEFDEYIHGHTGGGRGKDGHCWNIIVKYLELLKITVDEEIVNSFLY